MPLGLLCGLTAPAPRLRLCRPLMPRHRPRRKRNVNPPLRPLCQLKLEGPLTRATSRTCAPWSWKMTHRAAMSAGMREATAALAHMAPECACCRGAQNNKWLLAAAVVLRCATYHSQHAAHMRSVERRSMIFKRLRAQKGLVTPIKSDVRMRGHAKHDFAGRKRRVCDHGAGRSPLSTEDLLFAQSTCLASDVQIGWQTSVS